MPIETVERDYYERARNFLDKADEKVQASHAPLTEAEIAEAQPRLLKQVANGFDQSAYEAIIGAVDLFVKRVENGAEPNVDYSNANAVSDLINYSASGIVENLNIIAETVNRVQAVDGDLSKIDGVEKITKAGYLDEDVAKLQESLKEIGITKEANSHDTRLKLALHKLEGVGKLDELATRYVDQSAEAARNTWASRSQSTLTSEQSR